MSRNRAWLYPHVDHKGPESTNLLKMQQVGMGQYAKEHDFEIIGSSCDIGNSLTFNRQGFLEFHASMERGQVDVLLLPRLSRLGRDLFKAVEYWQVLREHHVRLCTMKGGEIHLDVHHFLVECFEKNALNCSENT